MGGVEVYIFAFEDVLTSAEKVGEPCSENFKKMTFLSGIVEVSYSALHDILMENDSKTYNDCILAIRKKGVDIEESKRSCHPLRRVAANLTPESPEGNAQVQQNVRYLPKELWESFSPEQKRMHNACLCQVKNSKGATKLIRKTKSLPSQYGTSSNVNLVDTETSEVEDDPEPGSPSVGSYPDASQEEESEEPDLSDFQERSTNMMAHYNVNNVTTTHIGEGSTS